MFVILMGSKQASVVEWKSPKWACCMHDWFHGLIFLSLMLTQANAMLNHALFWNIACLGWVVCESWVEFQYSESQWKGTQVFFKFNKILSDFQKFHIVTKVQGKFMKHFSTKRIILMHLRTGNLQVRKLRVVIFIIPKRITERKETCQESWCTFT